jgi:hypothetical protein
VQTAVTGHSWHTAVTVHGLSRTGVVQLDFPAVKARFVRLRMTKGNTIVTVFANNKPTHPTVTPMLQELTVS